MIGIVLFFVIPLYTAAGILTCDKLKEWWGSKKKSDRVTATLVSAVWPVTWLAIGLVVGLVRLGGR